MDVVGSNIAAELRAAQEKATYYESLMKGAAQTQPQVAQYENPYAIPPRPPQNIHQYGLYTPPTYNHQFGYGMAPQASQYPPHAPAWQYGHLPGPSSHQQMPPQPPDSARPIGMQPPPPPAVSVEPQDRNGLSNGAPSYQTPSLETHVAGEKSSDQPPTVTVLPTQVQNEPPPTTKPGIHVYVNTRDTNAYSSESESDSDHSVVENEKRPRRTSVAPPNGTDKTTSKDSDDPPPKLKRSTTVNEAATTRKGKKSAKDPKTPLEKTTNRRERDEESSDAENSKDAGNEEVVKKDRRIRTVKNRWNDDKSKWEDVEVEFDEPEDLSNPAAIWRKGMNTEDKLDFEEIEIFSKGLKSLLAEVAPVWKELNTDHEQQLFLPSPFYNFIWNWETLQKASEPKDSDDDDRKVAREDLRDLIRLISTCQTLRTYFRSRDSLMRSKSTKFEYLWTLYGHGTKVYVRSYMNELQMFEVRTCIAPPYKGKKFCVTCAALDWDGESFTTHQYDFYISEFIGDKPISSLEVVPVAYYSGEDGKDATQLREALIKRGKKYFHLCTHEPTSFECEYQGTALVTPTAFHKSISNRRGERMLKSDANDAPWEADDEIMVKSVNISGVQSRVIADNYSYLKSGRNTTRQGDGPPLGKKVPTSEGDCPCGACKSAVLQRWKFDSNNQSFESVCKLFPEDEERFLMLPPRMLGYVLKDKVWGQFLVDKLEPIESVGDDTERPFWNELELEDEAKNLLMAYMQHHKAPSSRKPGSVVESKEAKAFDIIEGKGQGLVILLHGPPGVGKTLTAETIALATGRPLLSVSVAEIGVEYQQAEQNLAEVFMDASRWEAVLLMDEADVFVEERKQGELQRNALVSVLLRCLEYFNGIIIMTTNRVRSIDAAVQSRIQLAIQYKDLKKEQRIAIYRNRIKYIPLEEIGTEKDRQNLLDQLENSQLIRISNSNAKPNGRQIRNIVTYARALAKRDKTMMTLNHLIRVHETTTEFTNSMKVMMTKQRFKNELDFGEER